MKYEKLGYLGDPEKIYYLNGEVYDPSVQAKLHTLRWKKTEEKRLRRKEMIKTIASVISSMAIIVLFIIVMMDYDACYYGYQPSMPWVADIFNWLNNNNR